jgi:hypothetical protein
MAPALEDNFLMPLAAAPIAAWPARSNPGAKFHLGGLPKKLKINLAPEAGVIHAENMPALTIKLPVREDQEEFNLRRWGEMTGDTVLGRQLASIEGRIETDRHGRIILLGLCGFLHGCYQAELAFRLDALLMEGATVIACPISTADGVKAADVAWVSHARRSTSVQEDCLTQAPEICVEILSSTCSRAEMSERKALFFDAGAREVWFCDQAGEMTFYCAPHSGAARASIQCPDFPQQISL